MRNEKLIALLEEARESVYSLLSYMHNDGSTQRCIAEQEFLRDSINSALAEHAASEKNDLYWEWDYPSWIAGRGEYRLEVQKSTWRSAWDWSISGHEDSPEKAKEAAFRAMRSIR